MKKKVFMGLSIISLVSCFAFHFDKNGVHWFWQDLSYMPLFLGALSIVFVILWWHTAKSAK